MFFAQVTEASSWLQVILQFGSLGILGYFLLSVQPETARSDRAARMDEIRLLLSMFVGERTGFTERAASIEAELKRLREHRVCKLDVPAGQQIRVDPMYLRPPTPPGESG